MEVDVERYKKFMEIDEFPPFEIEYFKVNDNEKNTSFARAEYDYVLKQHTLYIPSNPNIPEFILFHELTHIMDMENLKTGDKVYDYCLTGYMEYHASQVELIVGLGATKISDSISFSMMDSIIGFNVSVQKYLDSKYKIVQEQLMKKEPQEKHKGVDVFFNFLGLKSICKKYSVDFIDNYSCQEILNIVSIFLFNEINKTYSGKIVDVRKAVILYSNLINILCEG